MPEVPQAAEKYDHTHAHSRPPLPNPPAARAHKRQTAPAAHIPVVPCAAGSNCDVAFRKLPIATPSQFRGLRSLNVPVRGPTAQPPAPQHPQRDRLSLCPGAAHDNHASCVIPAVHNWSARVPRLLSTSVPIGTTIVNVQHRCRSRGRRVASGPPCSPQR